MHSLWKKIKAYFSGMKYKVFDALESHLQASVKEGESHLSSLRGSLASEAKSTAGDKHETGRAMIHQEMRQVNDTLQRSQSAKCQCPDHDRRHLRARELSSCKAEEIGRVLVLQKSLQMLRLRA